MTYRPISPTNVDAVRGGLSYMYIYPGCYISLCRGTHIFVYQCEYTGTSPRIEKVETSMTEKRTPFSLAACRPTLRAIILQYRPVVNYSDVITTAPYISHILVAGVLNSMGCPAPHRTHRRPTLTLTSTNRKRFKRQKLRSVG